MATSFAFKPITTNGLVLYLDAANTKSYPGSGTTWIDLTTNRNNGTLTNFSNPSPQTILDSAYGGSILFDGVNDYVDLSTKLRFSNRDITYDFWVKSTDNTDVYHDIIVQADPSQTNLSGMIKSRSGVNNGSVYLSLQGNLLISSLTGAQLLTTGIINYTGVIKLVSGFYNMYLYRNGILDNQRTTTISSYNMGAWASFQTRIGGGTSTYPEPWKGNIYCGRVYNIALTQEQVLQNYNATKGRFV